MDHSPDFHPPFPINPRTASLTLMPANPHTLRMVLFVAALAMWPPAAAWSEAPRSRWQLFAPVSTTPAETTPHPAVARIVVDEGRLQANGTGSLVATRDNQGLVITNWHVVRDARGAIQVIFPDGFTSPATVLKTDSDWDLAALLIWKPNAAPLTIAPQAPQPGDPLKIAGYGPGDYRAIQGKCTQYVAPSVKHPYEIVELSAEARQGDSGGPILNAQGELAGVLFGASRGSTSGSYCGRVRWFLSAVWPEIGIPQASAAPSNTPFVTYQTPESPPATTPAPFTDSNTASAPLVPIEIPEYGNKSSRTDSQTPAIDTGVATSSSTDWGSLPPLTNSTPANSGKWEELVGRSRLDIAKSVLAVIGLLAIWGHLARWISN